MSTKTAADYARDFLLPDDGKYRNLRDTVTAAITDAYRRWLEDAAGICEAGDQHYERTRLVLAQRIRALARLPHA